MAGIEIHCPGCKQETLLKRTPRYEGFKRVGETLACAACGHCFASEAEVPFKQAPRSTLFSKQDLPPPPKVLDSQAASRLCRHCAHYVVNPFVQRCARSGKLVEATDTCPRFEPKPPTDDEHDAAPPKTPGGIL